MRSKKQTKKGKAQSKGVRYIAKKLNKYQESKYPKYKDALSDARDIFGKLKENKQDVTIKNIWGYSRKKRTPRESEPVLPISLSTPDYYFQLVLVYREFIKTCTNKIWFESSISPSTLPPFQGGTTIDADEYFKDFVRYCNTLKSQTDPNESRYETEWKVVCLKPEFKDGKWVSKIICGREQIKDGKVTYTETLYGFNPDKPSAKPLQPMPPSGIQLPPPPSTPPPPTTPPPSENRAEAIRDIIAGLRSDLEKGYITKEQYQKLLNETYNLKKGGNI